MTPQTSLKPPRDCSFSDHDWAILARHWFPVARLDDLGTKPLAVTLLDMALVVYRAGDGIVVAQDLCPHRGVPLSMGWVEGAEIVCAYHGLRYGTDGRCTGIPAQPDKPIPSRLCVRVFPVLERYGLVWTCLDPAPDMPAPVDEYLPAWNDPAFQPILPPPVDIAAAAGRQVEGFIDVAHFAWVHHNAFADRDNPVVPPYSATLTPYGLHMEYWSGVSNYPKALQHLAPPDFQWLRAFDVFPPFVARLTVHFPGDGRLWILNAASPVSARRTRLFVPIARNFDQTGSLDEVYAFNAQIFAEDQAIVEAQRPQDLPLDPMAESHIMADRSSIAYRRLLSDLGLGQGQAS